MPSAASRSGVCGVSWKSGPDQPTGRWPVALSTAAIAALLVAVAADIGKIRLVPAPQPLGAAQRADRQRRIGRHLPVPVLEVDDDGEGDAGVVRPSENRARDNRGPRIKILVHAIGSFCRHSSTALPWRVLIKSCG